MIDPDYPDYEFADFPAKLAFLFEPMRYKCIYGGRGGAKSWSIARTLSIIGSERPIRWLCARETMTSLKDSVHKLLGDQIAKMRLPGYRILENAIVNRNGTEFTFAGLKNNATGLKSYEGADGVWVEEAANVSESSWDMLIPTIRKESSEIWVSFNPVLATQSTYKRFVLNPPANCRTVKINWDDNPWFTDAMRVDMEVMRHDDPEKFAHIWGGECRSAVEGAIFGLEVKKAEAEGRIGSIPFDRTRPVDTVWDLGFRDKNAIWFVQAYGGYYNFIDYIEDSGKTIHDYLVMLQARAQTRGYVYGTDWLPHDGVDAIIHTKLTSNPARSPEMLLRAAGRNVRIVVKLHVSSRINAGRTIFPQCRFDRDRCEMGLQSLRMWQWTPAGQTKMESGATIKIESGVPLHDEYSHGADAFTEAAVCIQEPPAPKLIVKPKPMMRPQGYNPFG